MIYINHTASHMGRLKGLERPAWPYSTGVRGPPCFKTKQGVSVFMLTIYISLFDLPATMVPSSRSQYTRFGRRYGILLILQGVGVNTYARTFFVFSSTVSPNRGANTALSTLYVTTIPNVVRDLRHGTIWDGFQLRCPRKKASTEVQRIYCGVRWRVRWNKMSPDGCLEERDGQLYQEKSPIIKRRRLRKSY